MHDGRALTNGTLWTDALNDNADGVRESHGIMRGVGCEVRPV